MKGRFGEQFVVNIGGRNAKHYGEARPIADVVAKAMLAAQRKSGPSSPFVGKNGGLTGSMEAFLEAWRDHGVTSVPVLTPELDTPEYAPPVARDNSRKLIKKDNTDRLAEIIKHPKNRVVIVTAGGTGTLEEICAVLCENEFRIKWSQQASGEPFPMLVAGDTAVTLWRPILQQVFRQLDDTHPLVERLTTFISTEYSEKGFLFDELVRILCDP
jgi:predicted Rossmann-fold nucleotide-binding protein